MSSGMRLLLYLVSFFIPIAGFVIGLVYYTKPEPEHKHVGKICLILAVVSLLLTTTLAAVIYVMVLGFGFPHPMTPTASLTRTTVPDGYRFTFTQPNTVVNWGSVTILVSDGEGAAPWHPDTGDMIEPHYISVELGLEQLGDLEVQCVVTDYSGNGAIDNDDSFTIIVVPPDTFSPLTTYSVSVIHEPSDGLICGMSFSG